MQPLIAPKRVRSAVRLRPRKVLCSECKEKRIENVSFKALNGGSNKPVSKTGKDCKSIGKKDTGDLSFSYKRKLMNDNMPSNFTLAPKIKKLKQGDIERNINSSSNCSDNPVINISLQESFKNKENRIEALTQKMLSRTSSGIRRTRSSLSDDKPVFQCLDMKSRRDSANNSLQVDDTPASSLTCAALVPGTEDGEKNVCKTVQTNPSLTNNKLTLTISQSGNKTVTPIIKDKIETPKTPSLKICLDPDGNGRVLPLNENKKEAIPKLRVLSKGAKLARHPWKLGKKKIGRSPPSPSYSVLGGMTSRFSCMSPRRFVGGALSPARTSNLNSTVRIGISSLKISGVGSLPSVSEGTDKKHKRKGKHKKKHKSEKKHKSNDDTTDKINSIPNIENSNHPTQSNSSSNPDNEDNVRTEVSADAKVPSVTAHPQEMKLCLSLKRKNVNGKEFVTCENISPTGLNSTDRPSFKPGSNKIRISKEGCSFIGEAPQFSELKTANKCIEKETSTTVKKQEVESCIMKSSKGLETTSTADDYFDQVYTVGDIVWAKDQGNSWWPAKVRLFIV